MGIGADSLDCDDGKWTFLKALLEESQHYEGVSPQFQEFVRVERVQFMWYKEHYQDCVEGFFSLLLYASMYIEPKGDIVSLATRTGRMLNPLALKHGHMTWPAFGLLDTLDLRPTKNGVPVAAMNTTPKYAYEWPATPILSPLLRSSPLSLLDRLIDRGFTATQIGVMQSVHRIVFTTLNPLVAAYVDATKQARRTYKQSICWALPPFLCLIFTGTHFMGTLLVLTLTAVMRAPLGALTDALVLAMVDEDENRWGKARAVGAASWGLMNLFVTVAMEVFGVDTMFAVYTVASGVLLAVSQYLPESCGETRTNVTCKRVWMIFAQSKHSVAFFCNLILLGGGFSMVEGMLFIILDRLMNASRILCGLSVLITVIFELPIFAKAKFLLDTYGTVGLITLGQFTWVVRALFYAWMPSPYWVLLIEPLHGVTFALVWTASVHHVRKLAPPGLEASAQAVLSLTFMGLGSWIGLTLGGVLFDYIGYKETFVGFAAVISLSLVAYVLVTFCYPPVAKRHAKLSDVVLGDIIVATGSPTNDRDSESVVYGASREFELKTIIEESHITRTTRQTEQHLGGGSRNISTCGVTDSEPETVNITFSRWEDDKAVPIWDPDRRHPTFLDKQDDSDIESSADQSSSEADEKTAKTG
eukprot:GEMP01027932.1.p1 GENE.GEMP01027932.1~~GEMP01027932.1.p1  ORF type:complete len:685 (+),score=110.58 GEMP01027932.1:128-2056(+)